MNNLSGKFHSHITIKADDISLASKVLSVNGIKVKYTTIELQGSSKEQIDTMITQHFHTYKYTNYENIESFVLHTAKILEDSGIKVIRIKLEHESLPTNNPTENKYRECHIKLKIPNHLVDDTKTKLNCSSFEGFVLSRNPNEVNSSHTTLFLNSRVYSGAVLDFDNKVYDVVESLKGLGIDVVECKIESTTLDTRLELDKWWA